MGDNSASEPSTPGDSLRNFVAPEIKAEAYRAIDSYQANGAGQVSFEIGDTIHVLDKLEDGTFQVVRPPMHAQLAAIIVSSRLGEIWGICVGCK